MAARVKPRLPHYPAAVSPLRQRSSGQNLRSPPLPGRSAKRAVPADMQEIVSFQEVVIAVGADVTSFRFVCAGRRRGLGSNRSPTNHAVNMFGKIGSTNFNPIIAFRFTDIRVEETPFDSCAVYFNPSAHGVSSLSGYFRSGNPPRQRMST
jgi:hypothetical protein